MPYQNSFFNIVFSIYLVLYFTKNFNLIAYEKIDVFNPVVRCLWHV